MNAKTQYKLIKTICDLCDGENYVKYHQIKEAWPECPSHNAILNIGCDAYLQMDYDIGDPGYFPTPAAFLLVSSERSGKRSLRVGIASLIVGVLTLGFTVATFLVSCR